jgi:hypothetical protein
LGLRVKRVLLYGSIGYRKEYGADMAGRKRKVAAHIGDDAALVRARQFLADHGIDHTAIIQREDAASFMVEFAALITSSFQLLALRGPYICQHLHAYAVGVHLRQTPLRKVTYALFSIGHDLWLDGDWKIVDLWYHP